MAGVTTANGIDVPIKPHTQQVAASTPTDLVACFGCFSKLCHLLRQKSRKGRLSFHSYLTWEVGNGMGGCLQLRASPKEQQGREGNPTQPIASFACHRHKSLPAISTTTTINYSTLCKKGGSTSERKKMLFWTVNCVVITILIQNKQILEMIDFDRKIKLHTS
jgi:hypothetical protein